MKKDFGLVVWFLVLANPEQSFQFQTSGSKNNNMAKHLLEQFLLLGLLSDPSFLFYIVVVPLVQ